ncbi:hypothetical protein CPB86DRAFT_783448 [Serendipita vermifera]|nr:hypothetical protein CPB86DRAFT_783448 [Serendipita vermifera]
MDHQHQPALMDTDALSAVPVCNCHRRRNSLPGPGRFNTVHYSAPGHVSNDSEPSSTAPQPNTGAPMAESVEDVGEDAAPQDIPIQYIVDQLHRLGPFYWHKPDTTDCTIQVPIDQRRLSRTPNLDISSGLNTGVLRSNNLDIRRGSAPVTSQTNPTPRAYTSLKLHQFYLTAQSSLLRTLFSGSSVIGLVSPQTAAVPSTSSAHYALGSQPYGRRDSTPSLARIPRLLPSSAHHPTLYLPLPDPYSFPHIVHYLYFGSPAFIEEALELGRIRWEGVVRNVEYLGLFEEEGGIGIRRWLAEWKERQRRASIAHMHHTKIHHLPHVGTAADPIVIEESSEGSQSDDNHGSDTAESDDMDYDMDDIDEEEEEEDDDDQCSSGEDWDPMVLAIAGMKMADPFALDPHGYARARVRHTAAMRMESVDPLQG